MNPVVSSLKMQFEAGPETHRFYACEQHYQDLYRGRVSCFLLIKNEYLEAAHEDEAECYFCRGEDGP